MRDFFIILKKWGKCFAASVSYLLSFPIIKLGDVSLLVSDSCTLLALEISMTVFGATRRLYDGTAVFLDQAVSTLDSLLLLKLLIELCSRRCRRRRDDSH